MRNEIYFVSDVHIGLNLGDPQEREERFAGFLRSLPRERTRAVYMLGDIWDFWFEYRDVVPRYGAKVVAAMVELVSDGIEVWFCRGNHDVWTFSFFQELGMHKFEQPYFVNIDGKEFCLGHGDLLGGSKRAYRMMMKLFNCRFMCRLFAMLHPRAAFSLAMRLSKRNRGSRKPYHFRGKDEPLYKFADEVSRNRKVDYFVFGHFHEQVDMTLPSGSRFMILKDWIHGGISYGVFNASSPSSSFELHSADSSSGPRSGESRT